MTPLQKDLLELRPRTLVGIPTRHLRLDPPEPNRRSLLPQTRINRQVRLKVLITDLLDLPELDKRSQRPQMTKRQLVNLKLPRTPDLQDPPGLNRSSLLAPVPRVR